MNNPVFDAILKRRSIRRNTSQKVEKEKIDLLLKAAMAAPSACNLQPWSFIVVGDESILDQVKKATGQGQYNAPLAIVVCGEYKHRPWEGEDYMIDCGMATENILLEAVELGLASVVIGGFEEEDL